MKLIEGIDYFIYYMNLPPKIYAFVMPNEDATFSIFLDHRRDYYHRMQDLEHELNHIRNGDLYSCLPVQALEDYLQ